MLGLDILPVLVWLVTVLVMVTLLQLDITPAGLLIMRLVQFTLAIVPVILQMLITALQLVLLLVVNLIVDHLLQLVSAHYQLHQQALVVLQLVNVQQGNLIVLIH